MRILIIVAAAILLAPAASAQDTTGQAKAPPCSAAEYRKLDFWVGEWEVNWAGKDGETASGRNRIERVLRGCAIEENFDGGETMPLQGRSLSIYDARTQQWRQTWVDNQGGVFVLTGGPVGDEFVLETEPFGEQGEKMLRMVFTDIEPGSLTWLWQATDDRGQTWETRWKIDYARRNAEEIKG